MAAYGSYRDFRKRRGELVTTAHESENLVFAFNWPFLVPSDTKRPPRELLKQAVELAETDEVALWREAVQRWRRDTLLRGLTDAQATEEIEGLVEEYAKAARKAPHRNADTVGGGALRRRRRHRGCGRLPSSGSGCCDRRTRGFRSEKGRPSPAGGRGDVL